MTQTALLADRAVLRVSGADARAFLNGLLTNDVTGALPVWAGLLTAQGKYLFDMIVHDGGGDGGALLLDVAADRAEALAKRLTMYKLRRAVTVEATDLSVFAAWDGPADAPFDPRLPGLGRRWVAESGATTATLADWHAHRIATGVADSADFEIEGTMWLEGNATELNGVSFTKGCYVGQENTARMQHRGKVRKRLLPVLFERDPGDGVVRAGDRVAGELRTRSGGRGIALLRVEYLDAALTMNGVAVTAVWPSWLGERDGAEEAAGA
jgi:hypothetical protein